MNKKGFTLVELLATISILIIIVSISIPSIISIKEKDIEKTKIKNAELIENAAELYFETFQGKIENIDDLDSAGICLPLKYIVEENLVKVPSDPETGTLININSNYILLKRTDGAITYKYKGCTSSTITFKSWE